MKEIAIIALKYDRDKVDIIRDSSGYIVKKKLKWLPFKKKLNVRFKIGEEVKAIEWVCTEIFKLDVGTLEEIDYKEF